MTPKSFPSTRRWFLKGGALLAVPVAAGAMPAAALADDGLQARVDRLEDEAAIRDVHEAWLRRVNAGGLDAPLDGGVRRIFSDHAGAPDWVELAADGRSAAGRFDCTVETETVLAEDCTLAQMARVQGHGALRRTERRRLTVDYTKTGSGWKIARLELSTI